MNNQHEKKEHFRFITNYYAIATLVIVFVHARMMHQDNPKWLAITVHGISAFHMPAFFFIAGVLLVYTADRYKSVREYTKKKCVKLLVPYLTLTLLAFIPKVLLNDLLGRQNDLSLMNLIRSFLRPQESVWGHFWFIPVYCVMMPIAFLIYKHVTNRLLILLITLTAIILNLFPIDTYWFGLSDITYQALYLILGMLFSAKIIKIGRMSIKPSLLLGCCVLLLASLILSLTTEALLCRRLASLFGIALYLLLSLLISNKTCHILTAIGNHTFTIYIYSWPIQSVLEISLLLLLKLPFGIVFSAKLIAGVGFPLLMVAIYNHLPKKIRLRVFDYLLGID